ncbi:MAG: cytochrome c [Chloroflexi bacterium]|nr:cytochrome c [Chloroflexota bacterium]
MAKKKGVPDMQKAILVMAGLAAIGLFVLSCSKKEPGATSAPPPPATTSATATSAVDGAKLFAANCAVCHGQNRQGVSGLGPALTPASLAKLSEGEVKNTILKGRQNTAMAGFEGRLGPQEIDALVKLVKTTSP